MTTQITQETGSALTLQFASPEQLTGGTITTATDVYSLGVLLYLLLTGRHPAGDGHSPVELLNAIAGKEPARASDAAICGENDTAARRGSTPIKLRRELRGDLDTILAKTLKKNPAERYLSVNLLADDLQRYLQHQPISARSDSFLYRTGKFVRRNRTALTLIGIATLLVLTSLTGGMYIANRQRKIAERRFVQVRQLANKFIALDEALRGLPGTTKVRSRMVVDSLQYLNSLGNEVHGDKQLALDIAYAYVRVAHTQGDPTSPNLGQFADAEISLSNASKFVDPILAKEPNDARALSIAVTIAHDRMALDQELGHPTEQCLADAARTASLLDRYRQSPNFNAYATVYFYTNVANNYASSRHFDEAIRYSQLAEQLSEFFPVAHQLRGNIIEVLAGARWQKGNLAGALQVAREAVENQEQQASGGHVTLRINLADSLQEQARILGRQDAEATLERTPEALALFQKAQDIVEELASRDSSDYRSREESEIIGLEIGNILRHTNPKRALAVYGHSLARLHEMKGDALLQKDEAELLANSAYALQRMGQSGEARRRIDRAFQLLRNVHAYPADVIEPLTEAYDVVRSSADNYVENGEITKAIETYQELLERLMRWNPHLDSDLRDAVCISRTWSALAELLRIQHRHAEANELERQRAELWQRWQTKLPNSEILLRQSLKQAYELPKYPHPTRRSG